MSVPVAFGAASVAFFSRLGAPEIASVSVLATIFSGARELPLLARLYLLTLLYFIPRIFFFFSSSEVVSVVVLHKRCVSPHR